MSSGPPPDDPAAAAAAAAAAKAARDFTIESFTLLGVGILVTILRTYSRVRAVGFKRLQLDDYLVWLALMCYAAETGLAYSVGNAAKGLANNGMTTQERGWSIPRQPRIRSEDPRLKDPDCWMDNLFPPPLVAEGIVAGLLHTTDGRPRANVSDPHLYRFGIGFLVASWAVVILNLYLSCRPFRRFWQINPDRGNVCQPAVSNQIVWVYLAMNVATDLYLLSIPLPMLWGSQLKKWTKMGLMLLFGGGIFVVACATLRCVLIVTDPVNGAQLVGTWAVRETFVATVTTNLPMIFPLLKTWFRPIFGTLFSMTMRSSRKLDDDTIKNRNVLTFGGGGRSGGSTGPSWRRRGPPTVNPLNTFAQNESEENMVDSLKMQDTKSWREDGSDRTLDNKNNNIYKQVDVAVVRQDADAPADRRQRGPSGDDQPWTQAGYSAFAAGSRQSRHNSG